MPRTIYAKNLTASGIEIYDLSGLYIDPYDTVDLSLFFSIDEIDQSEDLTYAIANGLIVLNDGEQDLSLEESYELSTVTTVWDVPHTFLDLFDTPSTYSGTLPTDRFIAVQPTEDGVKFTPISFEDLNDVPTYSGHAGEIAHVNTAEDGLEFSNISDLVPGAANSVHWSMNPTYNGTIRVVGWHYTTNTDYNLTSGNTFVALEGGYNSYFVLNIKSGSGFPFTLTVSGISPVDQESGSTYISADENITISGTGYYRTVNRYLEKPSIYIVETGKSCTFDCYKFSTWDACSTDININGIGFEFVPDQNNWDFNMLIYKVFEDGSKSLIRDFYFDDTDTYVRAAADIAGVIKTPVDVDVKGSAGEGIVIYLDQNSIGHFCVLLSYS